MTKETERYTLKTTKIDYKNGKISREEFEIISSWVRARDKYYAQEEMLRLYYKNKYSDRINSSLNKEDLRLIKEELRLMPESVSKTLLFRHILMKEDEIL